MFIQALLNPETEHAPQNNTEVITDQSVNQQQNVQITKSSNSTQLNLTPEEPTPTNTIHVTQPPATNNNTQSQRSKKTPFDQKTEKCPICDTYLSAVSIQEHIQQELSKLNETAAKENVNVRTKRGAAMHARKKVQSQIHLLKESREEDDHEEVQVSNNSEILNSVRKRRQTRQHTSEAPPPKKRSSSSSSQVSKQECFLCGELLRGDDEDINAHIDQCLKSHDTKSSSSTSNAPSSSPKKSSRAKKSKKQAVHEEPEEQVETYIWCDETRVRSCSVVGEGYAELVNADRMKKGDETAELDVMDDDLEVQYGVPQYSEADLIRMDDNEDESERTLRKRVNDNFQNHTNNNNGAVKYSNNHHVEEVTLTIQASDSPQSTPLIEALKAKIVELQKLTLNSYKCLVCLEQYQVPLVSIQCWHVHCEKCWLSALGSKKLCPQCKAITTPNDLRKIFL